jgi:hypothetical protein
MLNLGWVGLGDGCGKPKSCKEFSKPNLEPLPSPQALAAGADMSTGRTEVTTISLDYRRYTAFLTSFSSNQ